jgi:UDPglucose 6-dehydrogenase
MNVTVVGTGYVGLVTGCCLAEAGHQVICVDNDDAKVAELKQGRSPIYEPGLVDLLTNNIERGRLSFTTELAKGVEGADAVFLALPTPPQDDGSADLTAVLSVAKQLGSHMPNKYCVVIDKSTVPVGTADAVQKAIATSATGDFEVVSNPEFLREGHAVEDFMEPERVVIGVPSQRAEAVMRDLYEPFINDERPLLVTDPATAELAKYAANTFLVTKVSFMNEMSHLSEAMGTDIDMLRQIVGSDSRIGHKFLNAGIGAGGSCFPKDVRALKHMSDQHGYKFNLLESAITVNDQQQHLLAQKILDHFEGNIAGRTFALWGLAFKPQTDDIREAPALVIINDLLQAGAKVKAYDPEAGANVRNLYADNSDLQITDEKFAALTGSEALIIATEWPEFSAADLNQIKKSLGGPLVFDGRNIWQPHEMKAAGFSYYSIGRRPVLQ